MAADCHRPVRRYIRSENLLAEAQEFVQRHENKTTPGITEP